MALDLKQMERDILEPPDISLYLANYAALRNCRDTSGGTGVLGYFSENSSISPTSQFLLDKYPPGEGENERLSS